MNIIPLEYVTARAAVGLPATVVVSEFAGVAQVLEGAYMLNPHDLDGMRDVLDAALHPTDPARQVSSTAALEEDAGTKPRARAMTRGSGLLGNRTLSVERRLFSSLLCRCCRA